MPWRIAAEERDEGRGIRLAVWRSQWPRNREKKSPTRNTNILFFFFNILQYGKKMIPVRLLVTGELLYI